MAGPNEFDSHEGKPPKTAESIRASLQSIHHTAEVDSRAGPYIDGLSSDYPIAVATFYDPVLARSVQQLLSQSGIFSNVVRRGTGASVFVDNEDHVRAAQLLSKYSERFPNRIPKKESRRFDLLIFGVAIGFALGGVIVSGVSNLPEAAAILLTFTGIGATTGHLLDRLRMSYLRTGRFRVGVLELLLLMSIIGLAIMAERFIRSIFVA